MARARVLWKSAPVHRRLVLVVTLGLLACGCSASHGLGECLPGAVCVVAGTAEAGGGGDHGPALEAQLSLPIDVTMAPDGRLIVLDWNNNRVRAIDERGTIAPVAGTGDLGQPREGPAGEADLNHPSHVAFDERGRMLISTWFNGVIARVDDGFLEIIAGTGERSYSGDGGPALEAAFDRPVAVVVADDAVLVADQSNQTIRRISADGTIARLAGLCVTGSCAEGEVPVPCFDNDRLTCPSGDPTSRCLGSCDAAFGGDGGPALDARFAFPTGAASAPGGRIARGPDGALYVADTMSHRIRRIDPSGTIVTVVGTGVRGTGGDGGPALEASLDTPADVDVGADGTLYIADTGSSCIRAVDPAGTIRTIAGRCGEVGAPRATRELAESARFDHPYGIAVAADGRVFIADTQNHSVRVVVPR